MSKRHQIILSVAVMLIIALGTGFAAGFEYGTGIPITSLFAETESVATPEEITLRTTSEAKAVVEEALKDKTYGPGYNCMDYAWTAMRALNWDGQPAAIAVIMYDDGTGHALVLTATEDDGWVSIDPKTGMIVVPYVGGVLTEDITSINIMTIHWVPLEEFKKDPVFEVQE